MKISCWKRKGLCVHIVCILDYHHSSDNFIQGSVDLDLGVPPSSPGTMPIPPDFILSKQNQADSGTRTTIPNQSIWHESLVTSRKVKQVGLPSTEQLCCYINGPAFLSLSSQLTSESSHSQHCSRTSVPELRFASSNTVVVATDFRRVVVVMNNLHPPKKVVVS